MLEPLESVRKLTFCLKDLQAFPRAFRADRGPHQAPAVPHNVYTSSGICRAVRPRLPRHRDPDSLLPIRLLRSRLIQIRIRLQTARLRRRKQRKDLHRIRRRLGRRRTRNPRYLRESQGLRRSDRMDVDGRPSCLPRDPGLQG